MRFSPDDLIQLSALQKAPELVLAELERFRNGIQFIQLDRPCTVGDGIREIDSEEIEKLLSLFEQANRSGRVSAFIPASGAASRMFQDLQTVRQALDSENNIPDQSTDSVQAFQQFKLGIPKFAFRHDLARRLEQDGLKLEEILRSKKDSILLDYVLTGRGLNFVNMPKALIPFHDYPDGPRTALQEHLKEAADILSSGSESYLHFTVSPEYLEVIRSHIADSMKKLNLNDVSVETSIQSASTNTIAVTEDNQPFRDVDGRLVFRPAGHGALLDNLEATEADIVWIRNIDNIATQRLRKEVVYYRKILTGCLLQTQKEVHRWLHVLDEQPEELESIAAAARERLGLAVPESVSARDRLNFLRQKLDRPIRVCGMVRNQGEPGGGPFWVRDQSGEVSRQIVESSQIDLSIPGQQAILKQSTHFNPVDLVCGLRNWCGHAFDLQRYANQDACFISLKHKNGRKLKALELPGLWNGGMADWITLFVEVPQVTFNPVKTVNDLLRPNHLPA